MQNNTFATVSPVSSLEQLPNELWLEVFSNFTTLRSSETQSIAFQNKQKEKLRQQENQNRQRTLHSLCLTCHRFQHICTPLLYSTFHTSATSQGLEKLRHLYRTLSTTRQAADERPLAQYLDYIENRLADHLGNSLSDGDDVAAVLKLATDFFDLLVKIVQMASNVQELNVVSLETRDISFWLRMFGPKSGSEATNLTPCPLSKLRSLCIQTNVDSEDALIGLRFAFSDLSFPHSLAALQFSGIDMDPVFAQSATVWPFQQIQRLELTHSMLTLEGTLNILLACRSVRHITLHWAFLDCHGLQATSIVYPGLLQHKSTLETLHVDMRCVRFFRGFEDPDDLIGTFADFERLESLAICEGALPGSDWILLDTPAHVPDHRILPLLPQSLEQLVLLLDDQRDCPPEVDFDNMAILHHLLEDLNVYSTSLRELTIESRIRVKAPRLQQKFADVGIKMNVAGELSGVYGFR